METPGDFVLRLAAAVYEADPEDVARMIARPFFLMTPWLDIAINNLDDVARVLTTLRGSVAAAGVARMDRTITSSLINGETGAVVTMDTRRVDAAGAELGGHRSTFVLERDGQRWRAGSLILADQPDPTVVKTQVQRRFFVTYRNAENAAFRTPNNEDDG